MKIGIVGPGIMPIPPKGWGAVEILVWDYAQELNALGHEVHIINTPHKHEIIRGCNSLNLDLVHIQYDEFYDVIPQLNAKKKAITSHYGYLDQMGTNVHTRGYQPILDGFMAIKDHTFFIFALSESIKNVYKNRGFPENRIIVMPNGARKDLFKFKETPTFPDRSIFLAKIDFRKRQAKFQNYSANIYFAGNIADPQYNKDNFYLGEWSKDHLYNNLTEYANLILLSDGEADPLVTKEALMAGLGLVISQYSTANLDLSLPFIDVIPESKVDDIEYVRKVVDLNRQKSVTMRNDIRKYGETFDWKVLVKRYSDIVEKI